MKRAAFAALLLAVAGAAAVPACADAAHHVMLGDVLARVRPELTKVQHDRVAVLGEDAKHDVIDVLTPDQRRTLAGGTPLADLTPPPTPDQRQKIAAIRARLMAAVERVLSPDQLADFKRQAAAQHFPL